MAPTARVAPSACARFLSFALLPLFILCLSGGARAQTTATYHLHKEPLSGNSGPLQLKTAGPDARASTVSTSNLNGFGIGNVQIGSGFETQSGVPNLSGVIPAGSTVSVTLYMRKTGSTGVMYPRVIVRLTSSGTALCTVTGAAALTTSVAKYPLTCTTTADVNVSTIDRFSLWVGVSISSAATSTNAGELSIEGTLNGNFDSQLVVPLPTSPPAVSITSPANGDTFNSPAAVTINANASDPDGTVSKVEFFQGSTLLGTDTTSPYSFVWSNPPPAGYPYSLTAKATDNRGATATSSAVSVNITGAGTLGGSFSSPSPPAAVDLTAEGTADWTHWGKDTAASLNRKGGVAQQIGNFTQVNGGSVGRLTGNPTAFGWADGAPTAAASGVQAGVYVNGGWGNGLELTVPADTNEKTLKFYVGVWYAKGKLEATLSDGSALAFTDASLVNTAGTGNGIYTINFKAASAGQTLKVRYTIQDTWNPTSGYVSLSAATLSGGPPVLGGLSPASGPVGADIIITGSNFGNTQGTSAVTFNGVAAAPSSWSNTRITAAVPAGVTSGPVVVTARGLASAGAAFTVVPKINSVTPGSGLRGSSVTVSGTSFGATQGTSTLTFNGVTASPTSWGDTSIVAPVPAGATTGPLVVNVGGAAGGGASFTVITTGTVGGTVTRTSDGGPAAGATVQALQSGVVKASATTAGDGTYALAAVEEGTYDIRASAVGSQTETRAGVAVTAGGSTTQNFTLVNIGSASGKVTKGDGVTAIAGATVKLYRGAAVAATATTNATGDYSFTGLIGGYYTFEGSAAGYLNASRPGLVTGNANATVNLGLDMIAGGPVSYTYDEMGRLASAATATDTATYSYDPVGNLLGITRSSASQTSVGGFTPSRGAAGTAVTISGTGFSPTAAQNAVSFGGTQAAVTSSTATRITATVPAGAATGPISVTSPNGSAASSNPFTVVGSDAPTVTSFTPSAGSPGTSLTITGTNFETVPTNNRVKVNASLAKVTSASVTSLTVDTPVGASGRVTVSTPYGTGVSSQDFLVPPPGQSLNYMEIISRMNIGDSRPVTIAGELNNAMLLFDGAVGQRVYLRWSGVTYGDSSLTLYNPDGSQLAAGRLWLPGSETHETYVGPVTLPLAGTYTLVIDPTSAGTAQLTVYDVPPDVTGPITLGGPAVTVNATTPGQNGRLTFTGTAGQRVSMRMVSTTIPSASLSILKPDGTLLGQSMPILPGRGLLEYFYEPQVLPADGTYTVLVDPDQNNTGAMTVQIYDVPANVTGTVVVNDPPTPLTITTPGQNAYLNFNATAGQQVTIRLTNNTIGRISVWVYNPDGSYNTSYVIDQGGDNHPVTWFPVNGTYLLVINPEYHLTGNVSVGLTNP